MREIKYWSSEKLQHFIQLFSCCSDTLYLITYQPFFMCENHTANFVRFGCTNEHKISISPIFLSFQKSMKRADLRVGSFLTKIIPYSIITFYTDLLKQVCQQAAPASSGVFTNKRTLPKSFWDDSSFIAGNSLRHTLPAYRVSLRRKY